MARRGGRFGLALVGSAAALLSSVLTTAPSASAAGASASVATASRSGASGSPAGLGPLVRVDRLAPPAAGSGEANAGAAPSAQRAAIEVVLAPSDPAGIGHLIAERYDPSSPDYHHWLSPGQFDAEFGPSAATVGAAEHWLSQRGLTATRSSTFTLSASAPLARLQSAFGTGFEEYRSRGGGQAYRAEQSPLVPSALASRVEGILGLSTLPVMSTTNLTASGAGGASGATPSIASRVRSATKAGAVTSDALSSSCPGSSGAGAWTFSQLSDAYGITTLHQDGLTGQGETVGLYELAPYDPVAVGHYLSCYGLADNVSAVGTSQQGYQSQYTWESEIGEADLDVEQAAVQAPGAGIVAFQGSNTPQGAYSAWLSAVTTPVGPNHTVAQVISTSWGECEIDAVGDGSLGAGANGDETLLAQAALQGQSVVAASGDSGSESCFPDFSNYANELMTNYPASNPYVTAVGGTSLDSSTSTVPETVWNDCQSYRTVVCAAIGQGGAGGGGLSRYESNTGLGQPQLYQWSSAQPCGSSCREVPDISANAGVAMMAYAPEVDQSSCDQNGNDCLSACPGTASASAACWTAGVGTSFSAPMVAGLVADRDQGCTATTGDFAKELYSLYDASSGHAYGEAFSAVTSGNNDLSAAYGGHFFAASPGYNLATGLGSPLATGLTCPEVRSISPSSAPPGSEVTVTGLGLEGATIDFGSSPADVLSSTATSATVLVPEGYGAVAVAASSASLGAGTLTASFTVDPGGSAPPATAPSTPAGTSGAVTTAPSRAPTAFSAIKNATVAEGASRTLVTQLTAGGLPVVAATVHLRSRPASSPNGWHDHTYSTNANGEVGVEITPKQNSVYQWSYGGDATFGASTSAPTTIDVAQTLSIYRTAATLAPGGVDELYGAVNPDQSGQSISIYELVKKTESEVVKGKRVEVVVDVWAVVGHATVKWQRLPDGVTAVGYVAPVRLYWPGSYTVHAYCSPTPNNAAGQSANVSIRVD